MKIKMEGCHFEDNGTAIKAPDSVEFDMTDTKFINNQKALDIFSTKSQLEQIGLPEDTPKELLEEVIEIYKAHQNSPLPEQENAISKSKLFSWLGHGASVASIASAIIALLQSI